MKFGTKAIHAGILPDPSTGAIMTPIFQTSTYVQEGVGKHKGYQYARGKNPTRTTLQNSIAALENADYGICFSSGMAAMDAVLKLLNPGDEVICTSDLYGGSYRLMDRIYKKYGIVFHFVDMTNTSNIVLKLKNNTKMIWIETPTNPLLNIVDIKAVSEILKSNQAIIVCDNTFATPFLQNPLDLGAHIVLHSATKYLGGHSDVILGALAVNDPNLADQLLFVQNAVGAVPGPQDCFLVLRGIKTLHIRVERACQNAEKIAHFLHQHPKIGKVYWPGFKQHPNHDIAASQMKMFGAMVSFDLKDNDMDSAFKILNQTHLFTLAESLGGVESLIGHPCTMTHASIPKEERIRLGITDSLIRLSVGIEDIEDLLNDLDHALSSI